MEGFTLPLHQQFNIQSCKNIIDKADPEQLRAIASALVEQFIVYQELSKRLLKHEWKIDTPCLPKQDVEQNSELLMLKAFRQSAMRFVEHLEGSMTAEEYTASIFPEWRQLSSTDQARLKTMAQLLIFGILSHESVVSLKYYDKAIKEGL